MSEDQYVKSRLRRYIRHCRETNRHLDFSILRELVEQWKFDYSITYR